MFTLFKKLFQKNSTNSHNIDPALPQNQKVQGFDIDAMYKSSRRAINRFAGDHPYHTFYAFAIDSGMLCFNAVREFDVTLLSYQDRFPNKYRSKDEILDLKYNTGDWAYQGFYHLNQGFNHDLYDDHYHIPFENSDATKEDLKKLFQASPYNQAMTILLSRLVQGNAFKKIKTTPDFKVFLADHNY